MQGCKSSTPLSQVNQVTKDPCADVLDPVWGERGLVGDKAMELAACRDWIILSKDKFQRDCK